MVIEIINIDTDKGVLDAAIYGFDSDDADMIGRVKLGPAAHKALAATLTGWHNTEGVTVKYPEAG